MTTTRTSHQPSIRAEPIDETRCRFVADRPLDPGRWAYFPDQSAAAGSPLADRLLAIDGVRAALVAHDSVTITRDRPGGLPVIGPTLSRVRRLLGDPNAVTADWKGLGKRIGEAIRDHLASGDPAVSDAAHAAMPSSRALADRVRAVLDEEVNPVLAGHGGSVELIEMRDNVPYVRMSGGCQGCGLADSTLRLGVEAVLRDHVPELGPLFDLTDHASGPSPFVRPGARGRSPFSGSRQISER